MNKTFKVIFSRVRSSYVVANEITRSAKKKGTKALLVAVALTLSSASYAGLSGLFAAILGSAKTVPASTVSWNSSSTVPSGEITSLPETETSPTEYRIIDMQDGASGSAEILSVSINLLDKELSQAVYGIYNGAVKGTVENANFSGETTSVTVKAGSSHYDGVAAVKVSKNTYFKAGTTTLTAESTTCDVYGLHVTGNDTNVGITGNTTISAKHNEASGSSGLDYVYGIFQEGGVGNTKGKTNLSIGGDRKTVSISATSGASENANKVCVTAANIQDDATLNVEGSTISLTSSGTGLYVQNSATANLTASKISIAAQKDSALKVSKGNATLKAENGSINLLSTEASQGKSNTTVLAQDFASVSLEAGNLEISHINKLLETAGSVAESDAQETTHAPGSSQHLHLFSTHVDTQIQSGTRSGVAIGSYSGANVTIKAATEINDPVAISVAGGSTTKINTDAARKTTITGDIVFGSNANLEIALSGSESSWTGRAYQSYDSNGTKTESVSLKPTAESQSAVTGFALKVANGAKWTLAQGKSFVNNLTLSSGGIVDAKNATVFNAGSYNAETGKVEAGITVEGTGNTLTLGDATEGDISIEMANASELITPLSTAFTLTRETVKDVADVVTDAGKRLTVALKEGAKSATIKIEDAFTVTTNAFAKMNAQYSGVTLNLANMTLAQEASESSSSTTNFTNDVVMKTLTGNGDFTVEAGKNLTLSGSEATSEIKTLSLAGNSEASSTLTLTNGTSANVNEITGSGSGAVVVDGSSNLSVGTLNDVKSVTLDSGSTLTLGSSETATKSNIGTIDGSGTIKIAAKSEVNVTTLSGSSTITVGNTEGEGATLSVENLNMTGGKIFVDPPYGSGYGDSVLRIGSLTNNTLSTGIVAGRGALIIIGATESSANSAIDSIAGIKTSQPFVFISTPITLQSVTDGGGYVLINDAADSSTTGWAHTVTLKKGALVINQRAIGSNPVFSGANAVSATSETTIAVVNAVPDSTITLAKNADGTITAVTGVESLTVLTDSPFVTGVLNAASSTISLTKVIEEAAVSTIASMGVQTMIRNADAVLSETIADRTAALEKGNGLWATVRGERFKQTSLGAGAGFKANVGYGAFGAEFTPTDMTSLGVAFQYGHGTVKGKVYSVKNKTKDYSFTLYGSALLGETGINLLGEVAYTKSKNEVTTSYDARLNQSLDAKMLSAGISAQKAFDVGSVKVTPSVGVRVSRLKTDELRAGSTAIGKQKQTLVQVPVAVRVAAKGIETTSGWTVTPHAKVAYVPTFGDKEIDILGVKKTVIDTSPVQGSLGIGFKKGNFSVDATAHVGAGKKGSSVVGAKLGVTYRF